MLTQAEIEGRLSLAQLVFAMRTEDDLDDTILNVLAPIDGVAEADRLRGGVHARSGRMDAARQFFESAMRQGDRYAQAYLAEFLQGAYGDQAAASALMDDLVSHGRQGDPMAMGAMARLARRLGQTETAIEWGQAAADLGDPGALRDLRAAEPWEDFARTRAAARRLADQGDRDACLYMAEAMWPNGDELGSWVRRGSEANEARCVALLASSEDPEVSEAAQRLLSSWGLPDELNPPDPVSFLPDAALHRDALMFNAMSAHDAGDHLNALRAWSYGAAIGDPACAHNLGVLLGEQAPADSQEWPKIGLSLALGPGLDFVGGEQVPLQWLDMGQFHWLEPDGWAPVAASPLAQRVRSFLTDQGAKVSGLGPAALVGHWGSRHRTTVHFAFTADEDGTEVAWIFAPVLIECPPGQPAPWGELPAVDEDFLLHTPIAVLPGFGRPGGVMSRLLEAVLRLGEDGSRVDPSDGPAGRATGRGALFPATPELQHPTPWVACGPTSSLVHVGSSLVLPLKEPLQQVTVGYAIPGTLSDTSLADVVSGVVDTLGRFGDILSDAFLEDCPTFAEFAQGIPVTLVPGYQDLFRDYLSDDDAAPVVAGTAADSAALLDRAVVEMMAVWFRGASYEVAAARARELGQSAAAAGDAQAEEFLRTIDPDAPIEPIFAFAAARGHADGLYGLSVFAPDPHEQERLWHEAVEAGSGVAMAQRGHQAARDGDVVKAMEWFHRAAAHGDPGALASLLWHCILTGDMQQGEAWFAEYVRMVAPRDIQPTDMIAEGTEYANLFSNIALIWRALGQEPQMSDFVWLACYNAGHLEAGFYLVISESLAGQRPDAADHLRSLDEETRTELSEIVDTVLSETTSPWTRDWFTHGRLLLGTS